MNEKVTKDNYQMFLQKGNTGPGPTRMEYVPSEQDWKQWYDKRGRENSQRVPGEQYMNSVVWGEQDRMLNARIKSELSCEVHANVYARKKQNILRLSRGGRVPYRDRMCKANFMPVNQGKIVDNWPFGERAFSFAYNDIEGEIWAEQFQVRVQSAKIEKTCLTFCDVQQS